MNKRTISRILIMIMYESILIILYRYHIAQLWWVIAYPFVLSFFYFKNEIQDKIYDIYCRIKKPKEDWEY